MPSTICEVHNYRSEDLTPCPGCVKENEDFHTKYVKEAATKILIKDELRKALLDLNGKIQGSQEKMNALIMGYLMGCGHDTTSAIRLSPDFTFIELIKKDKDNGSKRD